MKWLRYRGEKIGPRVYLKDSESRISNILGAAEFGYLRQLVNIIGRTGMSC